MIPTTDLFSPLPPGALTLRGGLERAIRASIDGWILGAVPYHDFSRIFREGRPKYATGEMWGKFVRSGCMTFRAFPDPAIRERMREAVSEILREIKDPRVSGVMLSVMNADVSADFKFAKVYYSVYGQHDEKELANGLRSAVRFVRARIADMLNLRVNPDITFVRDDGIRRGAEISALLKQIEPELEASAAREAEEARANEEDDGDA